MKEHTALIFSNQEGVTARVCPRGQIHLQVGYAGLTLPKDVFLDLAQVVRAVEMHLLAAPEGWRGERPH
jgi:hypothetical protein